MFFVQKRILIPAGKVCNGWKYSSIDKNCFNWIFILQYECSEMQKSIKVQHEESRRGKKK